MTPRPSMLLTSCLDVITRTAFVFSAFLLVAGHNAPGGGFVGGLVAGAAYVLRYATGGPAEVSAAAKVPSPVLLGTGLSLAVLTGAGGWLWGDAFLAGGQAEVRLPILDTLHMNSTLSFDVGVYLVVVGLVLTVLRTLGAEESE